jgi:hypothetical protein
MLLRLVGQWRHSTASQACSVLPLLAMQLKQDPGVSCVEAGWSCFLFSASGFLRSLSILSVLIGIHWLVLCRCGYKHKAETRRWV